VRIDRQWLEKHEACVEGKNFFLSEGILTLHEGTLNLIKKGKLDWANWLVIHAMSHLQKVMYANYAAKQVLYRYERCYPADRRPRAAIQAVERFVKNPTEKNRGVVNAAADAAAEAAADVADDAATHAADVAYAATHAADVAYAATDAAYAAYAATDATYMAGSRVMKIKTILYGLHILKEKRAR
jgi:hypothetical protein